MPVSHDAALSSARRYVYVHVCMRQGLLAAQKSCRAPAATHGAGAGRKTSAAYIGGRRATSRRHTGRWENPCTEEQGIRKETGWTKSQGTGAALGAGRAAPRSFIRETRAPEATAHAVDPRPGSKAGPPGRPPWGAHTMTCERAGRSNHGAGAAQRRPSLRAGTLARGAVRHANVAKWRGSPLPCAGARLALEGGEGHGKGLGRTEPAGIKVKHKQVPVDPAELEHHAPALVLAAHQLRAVTAGKGSRRLLGGLLGEVLVLPGLTQRRLLCPAGRPRGQNATLLLQGDWSAGAAPAVPGGS